MSAKCQLFVSEGDINKFSLSLWLVRPKFPKLSTNWIYFWIHQIVLPSPYPTTPPPSYRKQHNAIAITFQCYISSLTDLIINPLSDTYSMFLLDLSFSKSYPSPVSTHHSPPVGSTPSTITGFSMFIFCLFCCCFFVEFYLSHKIRLTSCATYAVFHINGIITNILYKHITAFHHTHTHTHP